MKQSVLLVHTPCPQLEEDNLDPPQGLLYIAAVLLREGYHVEILDLSSLSEEECHARLLAQCREVDFIGFSTYTSNYNLTCRLAARVKRVFPAAIIIAGGPHATALPNEIATVFDYVVVGEGENGILQAMRREKEKIICASPVENLDSLPLPAYHLVDIDRYTRIVDNKKALSILSTRGCYANCTFCNSIVFARRRFRIRSPEHISAEINLLVKEYGIVNFKFDDDLFTVDAQRIRKIFALTPSVTYRCFARGDTLTSEMCDVLKKTGCKHVSVGVESGSNKILRLMNKGESAKSIHDGLWNARKAGLIIRIYLIVGFPGETDETIKETREYLMSIPFDEFVVYPLIPYPGTPLFANPEKFGITHIDHDYDKYIQVGKRRATGFVFKSADFDEDKVEQWRKTLMEEAESLNKFWSSSQSYYK